MLISPPLITVTRFQRFVTARYFRYIPGACDMELPYFSGANDSRFSSGYCYETMSKVAKEGHAESLSVFPTAADPPVRRF